MSLPLAATANRQPTVSVLLPAWNEAAMIERCLDSLLAIDWSGLEIIVCAGGTDDTLRLVQRYASDRVTVLEQYPSEGKQIALRRCFAASAGEIIYLTDADCVIPTKTFTEVIAPIVDGTVEAVTGTCRPYPEETDSPLVFYQWSIERAVERRRSPESNGLHGRNAAITRRALAAVGGFEPDVRTGTDYHLARRLLAAGYTIRYVDTSVETTYAAALDLLVKQRSRWLRNLFLHGRHFNDQAAIAATMRTVILSASIIFWPLTWPWTRRVGILAWLTGFTYLSRRRASYAQALAGEIGQQVGSDYLLRLPVLTLFDAAANLWSVYDLRSSTRRWRW